MSVEIDVSFSELIDKIQILEIKLERMTSLTQRRNVMRELTKLREAEHSRLPPRAGLDEIRERLRRINLRLWDLVDRELAYRPSFDVHPAYSSICREAFECNGERARLKREIDHLLGSEIVEEKSFSQTGNDPSSAGF